MKNYKMHPVPWWKYLVMTACTMGFYVLFWSYHNWNNLKKTHPKYQHIWPVWRAIFYFVWLGPLLRATGVNIWPWPILVGVSYLLMTIVLGGLGLPLYFYALAFVIALGLELLIAHRINSIHTEAVKAKSPSYHWTFTNTLWSIFGFLMTAPMIVFFIASETLYIPPVETVKGEKLPPRVINILQENEYIEPNEAVKFYYSDGIVNYLEGGTIITDTRIVKYSDLNGNWMDMALFAEIDAIYVDYGNWLEETVYYVSFTPENDNGFWGVLSAEASNIGVWDFLEAQGVEVYESDIREEYYEF